MKKAKMLLGILLVVIAILTVIFVYLRVFIYKTDYMDFIESSVKGTGIDPYLILSIIRVESGFNKNALSSKEAKGLMQVRESTYADVEAELSPIIPKLDLFDPEINIRIGVAYFNRLINRYDGNYYLALLAYNGGLSNVNNWIKEGIIDENLDTHLIENLPFKETRNYLRKVISTYHIYKVLYAI